MFRVATGSFDYPTFAIYAEIGASDAIVKDILERLDAAIEALSGEGVGERPPLLLDTALSVALLGHPDRLRAIQTQLQKAEDDVRNDREQAKLKQKLLDASDRIREDLAARAAAARSGKDGSNSRIPNVPTEAEAAWAVAINLLGSGAERLEANIKRDLGCVDGIPAMHF